MQEKEKEKNTKRKEKKMKRRSWLLCVLAGILFLLAGCTKHPLWETKKDSLKIGISIYNRYDTFISELIECLQQEALELEKKYKITISLDVQDASANQITQNEQMEYFLERDCDIVCINLVDRTDASNIIERGKNANVPIIFFNRELVEADLRRWDKLYYVGADAMESGILQGEILIELLKEKFAVVDRNQDGILQYVMLEGEAGHQDSIVRSMYCVQTVTKEGYSLEKLADEIANWNRDQGKTKMTQWMSEFGSNIEVVFSNNDDMALGAVDALKESGYFGTTEKAAPVILGIDGTREGIRAVENKELLGTVVNDTKGQARAMLELSYSLCYQKPLEGFQMVDEKYIRCPYKIYTKNGE